MSPANPMIVGAKLADASALRPVTLTAKQFDEKWLQALLFAHPRLLPAGEISSDYARLIPLARELSVTAGPIDLVYVTPEGLLCLAETKLWRNPEAHRAVLAQILDYAKDLTQMDYGEFKARIEAAAARSGLSGNLLDIAAKGSGGADFDGIGFEQGLRRCLASGNFLLLIVGDRIRPEVVLLSDIVGKTPHLRRCRAGWTRFSGRTWSDGWLARIPSTGAASGSACA